MQTPRTTSTPWRNSAVSDGLTIINEEDSEKSSEFHHARGLERKTSVGPSDHHGKTSGSHESDDDADAITTASSIQYTTEQNDVFSNDIAATSESTVYSESKSLTRKDLQIWDHLSITIGPPVILILDLVVPCAIYYSWLHGARKDWQRDGSVGPKPVYNERILGLSIISFGFGEIYILLVRVVRLIKDRGGCAPLLSKRWWELDATSWVYLTALLIALIPFTISTTARPEVIPWLYIFPPGFLSGFLAVLAAITLIPFKTPVRINSEPRGSRLRPIVFYAAEDFIAVDGFQGRAFRRRYRARYEANPKFRRMILLLTLFWIGGVCVYNGLLAAVTWNLEFEYAFGTSLGILFAWIGTWAFATYLWVRKVVEGEKMSAREEKERRMAELQDVGSWAVEQEDVEKQGIDRH